MRKINVLFLPALILGSFVLLVSSCKDDPPVKPKLSFSAPTLTAKESDANLQLQVVLDKAASEDIEIEYKLAGDALDDVTAGSDTPADYEVVGDYGKVKILKGETTGIIELNLFSDSDFETEDETIEISIQNVDSDQIEITREDEITITVQQEDGLIVLLEWGKDASPAYTDVDMDLFLWAPNSSNTLVAIQYVGLEGNVNTNLRSTTLSPEYFFLPTALAEDGPLGISCAYWGGTKEPMDFQVSFIEIVNGDDVSTEVKKFTYTLANINEWTDDDTGTPLQLLATFKKAGTDFSEFVALDEPVSGSRMGSSGEITLKKQTSSGAIPNSIQRFLNKK